MIKNHVERIKKGRLRKKYELWIDGSNTFFGNMPDFRLNRNKLHKLSDILMIALCAMIGCSNNFEVRRPEEIALYGQEKESFLRTFLEVRNGIPSRDTFTRVFSYLDKKASGECLYRWSNELLDFLDFHQINIDGKVIRATGKKVRKIVVFV